jgi:hypothetical protein
MCPKGSEIILLSDFVRLNHDASLMLRKLGQHNKVRLVQIYDPLEKGITNYRGTEQVSDKHTTRWLDFSSTKTRQGIESAFTQHQQQLTQLAHSLGMSFSTLSSDTALSQQLHGF